MTRTRRNRTRNRAAAIVAAALVLGAAQAVQQYEDGWTYYTSIDGYTHWLYLSAHEAEVRTPYGVLTTAAWPGQRPPSIGAACREAAGEADRQGAALDMYFIMSAHPEEPIPGTFSLRSVWWWLTGTEPEPRTYPTTVRIGSSRFESTFKLPPVRYLEPDAEIPLEPEATARELLAAAGPPLVFEATGRTEIEASFRVPEGYHGRLRQMIEACPVTRPDGPGGGRRTSR